MAAPAGPSSADPLGPARANASALSLRALQEAQLVHQRTVRYQVDAARAVLLREELANSEATGRALRSRAGQTESLLRQEALLSYADAVPEVSAGGQSTGDLVEVTDQTTYLALTVGDISGTLKLLQTEQSQLAGTVAASRRELENALKAEGSADAARQLALREAGSLQVLLSRAQSQVAALTAERPPTGPPVGDGIVKAVAQELGAAPATQLRADNAASPARAPTGAVTRPKTVVVLKTGLARTAAPVRTVADLAKTRAGAPTTLALSPTTSPRTTTPRPPATTAGTTSSTVTGKSPTSATTTSTAAADAGGTAGGTPTTSPTNPSAAASSTTTSSATTATTATTAVKTGAATTTSGPAPPTTPTPTTTPPTTNPPTTTTPTTTSTTTTPPTTSPPTSTATAADVHPPPAGGLWLELRDCESGDNYQADTGNGYYGAYQFSWPTWVDLGYPGRPDQEPYWMQDQAAQRLEAMDGWSQWPSCSAALGV